MFFLGPIELPDRLIDGRHSWQFGSYNMKFICLEIIMNHYRLISLGRSVCGVLTADFALSWSAIWKVTAAFIHGYPNLTAVE